MARPDRTPKQEPTKQFLGHSKMSEYSELAEKLQVGYAKAERQSHVDFLRDTRLEDVANVPIARTVVSMCDTMEQYNNPEWQEQALAVVLDANIYTRVDAREKQEPDRGYTDLLVLELLDWFKNRFFKWVNKPECGNCGNSDQEKIDGRGGTHPALPLEIEGRAAGVELYQCRQCGAQIRFPRLNNPATLLRTRRGRCGEWNNCFLLVLKSLGVKCRSIWNAEDHVWSEFYSEKLQRWVHLDSCENAFDNPMLYSRGWGKKMSYVFAFGEDYCIDVSEKYGTNLPRDKIGESQLSKVFRYANARKWVAIRDDEVLYRRLVEYYLEKSTLTKAPTPTGETKPRESGKGEWTAQRGENGV